MEDLDLDKHAVAPSSMAADALAIVEAYRDAVDHLSELYVLDEVARAKLMGLVVKIASKRLRSANSLADQTDIETVAILAIRHFLQAKSGAR